jgi:hypothetical protein
MIRDPSDGSVREPKETESADSFSAYSDYTPVTVRSHTTPPTSGLPPLTKNVDQLARLERDREWLKNYLHRKPVVEQGE